MATQEKLYTVDDLWVQEHLPAYAGQRLELINGKIVAMSPGQEHGIIVLNLGSEMRVFVKAGDLGVVAVEVGHYDPEDPHNVRLPDISFVKKSRVQQVEKGYVPYMPDLAVEVKSPGNTFEGQKEKAYYYLNHGVKLVWVIYPNSQTVEVYTDPEQEPVMLTSDDLLDGGDVLVGFSIVVKEIFP